MVRKAETKIYKSGARHFIYLRKDLVEDTSFPFAVGESLVIAIEGNTLTIKLERKKEEVQ